jgi:hypothetical protein
VNYRHHLLLDWHQPLQSFPVKKIAEECGAKEVLKRIKREAQEK